VHIRTLKKENRNAFKAPKNYKINGCNHKISKNEIKSNRLKQLIYNMGRTKQTARKSTSSTAKKSPKELIRRRLMKLGVHSQNTQVKSRTKHEGDDDDFIQKSNTTTGKLDAPDSTICQASQSIADSSSVDFGTYTVGDIGSNNEIANGSNYHDDNPSFFVQLFGSLNDDDSDDSYDPSDDEAAAAAMYNDNDMMPEENNNETVNGDRMPEIIEIVDDEDVQFIERDDIVLVLTLTQHHKNFNGEEHSFEAFTPSYCERDILL